MSSLKKKKPKKKDKGKKDGKSKKSKRESSVPASPRQGADNPFDSCEESLASSSEFEDIPEPKPLPKSILGSDSGSSDEARRRRTSFGGHRPHPSPHVPYNRETNTEIRSDRYEQPDSSVFRAAHSRSRSGSVSVPSSPRFAGDDEDPRASSPVHGASLNRTKTKYFTEKSTFLETERHMLDLKANVAEQKEVLATMDKRINEISSAQRYTSHRVSILMDMLSDISRGAQYELKNLKSLPYQTVPPVDKRPENPSWFPCFAGRSSGYQAVSAEQPPEDEDDQQEVAEPGCLCFL